MHEIFYVSNRVYLRRLNWSNICSTHCLHWPLGILKKLKLEFNKHKIFQSCFKINNENE